MAQIVPDVDLHNLLDGTVRQCRQSKAFDDFLAYRDGGSGTVGRGGRWDCCKSHGSTEHFSIDLHRLHDRKVDFEIDTGHLGRNIDQADLLIVHILECNPIKLLDRLSVV